MFPGFKYHLCAAEDRLGCEYVSLVPGHSPCYRSISHGLYEHEYVGGRAAAYRSYHIHKVFGDDFGFCKALTDIPYCLNVLFGHLVVMAHAYHAFSHHRGGVGHHPYKLYVFPEFLRYPGEGLSRSYGHDDLIVPYRILYILYHGLIKLGLYREDQYIRKAGCFFIVFGGLYPVVCRPFL